MAASATAVTAATNERTRLFGVLGMLGGLAYVIAGIIEGATGNEEHLAVLSLVGVWALGAIAGLVAIGLLGVAGSGLLGRIALGMMVLAYAVIVLDAILIAAEVYTLQESVPYTLARLVTLVGMLLLGIATVAAKRWAGWRRFAPFALLVLMPVTLVISGVLDQAYIPLFGAGLAWLVIGYAIWSTPSEQAS